MIRNIIKAIYLALLFIINKVIRNNIQHKNIVIFMTFKEDVLPVIKALQKDDYRITIITHPKHLALANSLKVDQVISQKNKYIIKQIKAIKKSRIVIIDNYYLLLGGLKKSSNQTVIQTWHAAGALKKFGLQDKTINHNHKNNIKRYLSVYRFTDYYLVSSNIMKKIFMESLDATEKQMLPIGLPRLDHYKNKPMNNYQRTKKIVLYVPTYRDYTNEIHTISKQSFEQACPDFELITKLHPTINHPISDKREIQTLVEQADVIITDYSSLGIEASLLDKTIIFYCYDEEEYDLHRGLNQYYYEMTKKNKAYDLNMLYQLVNKNKPNLKIKTMWHEYTNYDATNKLVQFINEECKK